MELQPLSVKDGKVSCPVFSQKTCQFPTYFIQRFRVKSREEPNTAIICCLSFSRLPQLIILNNRFLIFCFTLFLGSPCAIAQRVDTLPSVEMRSRLPVNVAASSTGVQEMDKKDLEQTNSLSVADAVKYFSGVLVKDYGGIGGLKTISVRSLGANHTGVLYDGMVMGDARAGLIDLGRLSTENLEYIRLYQSNTDGELMPARSFTNANLLVMGTSTETTLKGTHTRFAYKQGSFGFINPSASFVTPLTKRASLHINGSYQTANGRYQFNDYSGNGKRERKNSDTRQWRVEVDLPVLLADSSTLRAKVYYYQSQRGLPGAVLLYNESANERLDNTHLFAQLNWRKNLSQKWKLLLGGKTLFDRQKYFDPDFLNNEGFLENDFLQTENYFTASAGYDISDHLRTSFSVDYFVNILRRDDPFDGQFEDPVRKTLLKNLALTYTRKRINAEANILHSYIHNTTSRNDSKKFNKLTPAFSISVQPLKEIPLRARALYKHIFRAPSLDDMYFTLVGNANLKPEYATQYGAGLAWQSFHQHKILRRLLITADGYFISVKDKILALPRNNLFQWSMMNIGKAETKSLDVAVETDMRTRTNLLIRTNLTYSYQDARDVTKPGTAAYKNQLAYIPQHSGSARISAEIKNFGIAWNTLFSSHRYRVGAQLDENLVEGYALHDVNLRYALSSHRKWNYTISAELNNLLNKQYEVVKYFPMPGFNWRIALIVDHKK